MENDPLVSIIIPAYNAERYIRRSLESALNQTYKNIEIVVVDDGSTDKTASIIRSYQDLRIVYTYQKNQGQGAARNNGIRRSRGEYITFLDVDDYYLSEKVDKQIRFLQEHSEYQMVYCNALHYYSDNPSKLLKKKHKCVSGDIFLHLLHTSLINPNTIMFKREIVERHMFNEGIKGRYSEEWALYLKISREGFQFGCIDKDLVIVEIRKDSNTQWDTQWIIKKNTLEMFKTLFLEMNEEEKKLYKADTIIRKAEFKLAIAYLIGKKKREFFKTFNGLYRYPFRIFTKFIGVVLLILPFTVIRASLIKLWRRNQLHHMSCKE